MRHLRLSILLPAAAMALSACATSDGVRPEKQAEAPPATTAVREQILSESIAASRVVERDGQTCLQGLDAYGNVIDEQCEASTVER